MHGGGKRTRKQSEDKITGAMKDRINRDTRKRFESEEEYYKQERVCNCWNNRYIEYESNDNRTKNLSSKEYLDKIKPYLKDIINDLQKYDTWKIQLTIGINFIFAEDNDFVFGYVYSLHCKCHKINFKWWIIYRFS